MSSYTDFQVNLENKNSSWTLVYNEIKDDSKVLDVGCSSGYFDKILSDQKKCTVDGIEIDKDDAALAKKNCRKVIIGNVEATDFPWEEITDKYDYILFIDVLEHLLNPAKCLNMISKYLKKDGKVVFSIPNMANSTVRLQLLQGNFDYEKEGLLDETHLHYYTLQTIEKMVSESELKFIKLDATTFDTPKKLVAEVLDKVGLVATDKFYNYINSQDALVYQYIGVLDKKGNNIELTAVVEAIKPKIYYEKQLQDVQKDARNVFKNAKNLQTVIQLRDKEIVELRDYIESFEHKFSTKLMRKASHIKRRILKK